jgi:hypothetical protein
MIAALAYREKMTAHCKRWELEWFFPVPQTMSDGQRVRFEAEGLTPAAVEVEKVRKKQKEAIASLSPLEWLLKMSQTNWNLARGIASLPDLPEKGKLVFSFRDLPFQKPERSLRTGFTAPRNVAHEWLSMALQDNELAFQAWPAKPAPIQQSYHTGQSDVHIHSTDGETVTVIIHTPYPNLPHTKLPQNVVPKFELWRDTPNWPLLERVRSDDEIESLERRYRGMDRTLLVK